MDPTNKPNAFLDADGRAYGPDPGPAQASTARPGLDKNSYKLQRRSLRLEVERTAMQTAQETQEKAHEAARRGLDLLDQARTEQQETQAVHDAAARQNAATALHMTTLVQELTAKIKDLAIPQPTQPKAGGIDLGIAAIGAVRDLGAAFLASPGGARVGDRIAGLLSAFVPADAPPDAFPPTSAPPPDAPPPDAPPPAAPSPDAAPAPDPIIALLAYISPEERVHLHRELIRRRDEGDQHDQ